ncbi:hypothetical protein [Nostoc sphaeroides]|uniref:hypothetical protein n=1 Tax=Nostoc sphaeroides TaxID=446679 RepID=UPI0018846369|nr:hypothetical protein [Nostoc sphaeroides]
MMLTLLTNKFYKLLSVCLRHCTIAQPSRTRSQLQIIISDAYGGKLRTFFYYLVGCLRR